MCTGCMEEYDAPAPVTEAMLAARRTVDAVYAAPWGGVGGPLHVEIDDVNVDDHWFTPEARAKLPESWAGYYADRYGPDMPPEVLVCFDALAALTEAERATVCCLSYEQLTTDQ